MVDFFEKRLTKFEIDIGVVPKTQSLTTNQRLKKLEKFLEKIEKKTNINSKK